MVKRFYTVLFILVFATSFGQGMSSLLRSDAYSKDNWQVGLGADLVTFADSDVPYVKEKNSLQIPRMNVTRKINQNFSLDLAFSISGFDSVFGQLNNEISYFSADFSLRYNLFKRSTRIQPYGFLGLSYVDLRKVTSSSLNAGVGLTFWLATRFGLTTQIMYKNALNKQVMVSHNQVCGGIVFSFDNEKRINSSRCIFNR